MGEGVSGVEGVLTHTVTLTHSTPHPPHAPIPPPQTGLWLVVALHDTTINLKALSRVGALTITLTNTLILILNRCLSPDSRPNPRADLCPNLHSLAHTHTLAHALIHI